MKLNPPASSSDLDTARAIARRLHRRTQGDERAADMAPPAEAPTQVSPAEPTPFEPAVPQPAPFEPAAPEPAPFEPAVPEPAPVEPAVPEHAPVEPAVPEPTPFEPAAPEPAPVEPAVPEPSPFEPAAPETASFEPAVPEPAPVEPAAGEGNLFEPSALEPPEDGEMAAGLSEVSEDTHDAPDSRPIDSPPPESPSSHDGAVEGTSPSEPWAPEAAPTEPSAPWDGVPEGVAPTNGIDPDSALSGLGPADADPALDGLEPPVGTGLPEDLVGDAPVQDWQEDTPLGSQIEAEQAPESPEVPSAPSWDDVADSCLALAGVQGAMIVDQSGQVMAARGAWPEPGPEAIGGRLVSMMEKTLQDAPTRSVSAPLAGQHLTAWRVPANEGFLTVVFMGGAPLGSDVRAPIDAEVKQALGQ